MRQKIALLVAALTSTLCPRVAWAAVNFDFAIVGNPGNANDTNGVGGVSYTYRMSKTEVTNSQYLQFLNAKAATDSLLLYSTSMSTDPQGGINRSGDSGSYVYTAKPGFDNKPVVFVGWYSAVRFVNWLSNGQGNGSTESATYALDGFTATPANAATIARNAAPLFVVPTQSEWYKAAYYDPTKNAGTGGYWTDPMRSTISPVADVPPGSDFSANFNNVVGGLTDVAAYLKAKTFYGTSDQGGNVAEWNETLNLAPFHATYRGGSWNSTGGLLAGGTGTTVDRPTRSNSIGFRVAFVPEPAPTATVLVLAFFACVFPRRRRLA